MSSMFIYDERTGGKGGNEVCSIRWKKLVYDVNVRADSNQPHPLHLVSVLDNCTGQNKSKQCFKFEAFLTTLGVYQTTNKLFLKPGHSHNQSDVITGQANKFLHKKDIFTINQMQEELDKCPNISVQVLQPEDFYDWENFLNKFFQDMPAGFTKNYCFEFNGGNVAMKRLCSEDAGQKVFVKELLKDQVHGKKAMLKELFDLPASATLEQIVNPPLQLPRMVPKDLRQSKIESIAKKFDVIPPEHLPYYPGGAAYQSKTSKTSNQSESVDDENLLELLDQDEVESLPSFSIAKPKKAGRPKRPAKPEKRQKSIVQYFGSCWPKIPTKQAGEEKEAVTHTLEFGENEVGVVDLSSEVDDNDNILTRNKPGKN